MNDSTPSRAVWLGLVTVAAARLLALPKSLWEWDEVLFVRGVVHFDPIHHSPHPPGYPLLIGLGKLMAWITGDPFRGLVTLSVISSLVGFVALATAFRSFAGDERVGVAGALLFHLSPAMLVYGPLALSDPPALMFLSLALAAVGRLIERRTLPAALALGAFASAAIGCRPQLCLAVLPMLAVTLALAGWRRTWAVLSAFTAVSLLWFVPLVVAVGGPAGLVPFLTRQAGLVADFDAAQPRAGLSWKAVGLRFLAHPWGNRWLSLPILLLAGAGAVAARQYPRYRTALPLAVLTLVELTFSLAVMNPRDAVRYALPGMLGIAFAAGVGTGMVERRTKIPALLLAGLFAAGAVFYTWPLLSARTRTESPPVQAIHWAQANLPKETVFLVDKELGAHVAWLLPRSRATFDEGFAGKPDLPVWLIAEGETGWLGARSFLWPESDAYGKLTRDLYRVTSLSPIPPGRRYRVERGVFGYEPTAREAAWRWLAPEAAIRLVPAGARELTLSLAVPTVAPLASNRVTVTVAGVPAAEVEIRRGERRTLTVPLPAPAEVEVGFRSAASFVPAGAPRRLAVQLVGLEMK
ncbi:MAG: glycosyltransferase family 39 protein [Acidobacteriota bacterium]